MAKNYKTNLFEITALEILEKQKEFPSIHLTIKYNGITVHEEIHTSKSNEHAEYLINERLEACKSPLVLAFVLIKYGQKHINDSLVRAGKEYLESAI